LVVAAGNSSCSAAAVCRCNQYDLSTCAFDGPLLSYALLAHKVVQDLDDT
jgi:hypothetical protein